MTLPKNSPGKSWDASVYPHRVYASFPNVRFYSNFLGMHYSKYGIVKASVRDNLAIVKNIDLEIWAEDDPALGLEAERANGVKMTLTLDQVRDIRDLLNNVLREARSEEEAREVEE